MATVVGGAQLYVDMDTSKVTQSVSDMDKALDRAENSVSDLDRKTQAYNKTNRQMTKTAKETEKALAAKSRKIGQTSIQLQQMIGQVQGGVAPLTAFSQQIADIGIVAGFGFAGAMAGIGASIAGMLLPSLFKATDALEDIERATENVRAAMTLSADGVVDYSDKMNQLRQISESLFKLKLGNLIEEQKFALLEAAKGASDAVDEFSSLSGKMKLFGEQSFATFKDLQVAVFDFRKEQNKVNLDSLEAAINKVNDAGIRQTKSGRELTSMLTDLIAQYKIGEITVDKLNQTLEGNEEGLDKASDKAEKYDRIAESLSTKVFKLRSQSLELQKTLTLEAAARDGASEATIKSITASYDKIIANEREKESERALAEEARKRKEAQAESIAADVAAAAVMDKLHKDAMKRQEEKEKADKIKRKEAGDFATGISDRGMSEAEQRATEQILLEQYYEEGLISEQQYQDALTQIMAEGVAAREQMLQMSLGSFSSSFDEIAGVLKKSEGEQSNAYKAMFALSKGFAIAQAGLNLSLAVSNAMASGPFPWNLGAMAAVGAAGASLISSIGSAVYGGRENGGDMLGGKTYEVGEKNKPELLMIPGNGGKMFSNREAKAMMNGGGGGASLNQTINNYAAADGYQVRTRGDGVTQAQVIDIIRAQSLNPNSQMRRGLSQGTDIKNTPGGGRM